MFKKFVLVCLIVLIDVSMISGELTMPCSEVLSTLEIDYFVVKMEGQNVVSQIHMTKSLSECEGQVNIKAAYYNMERESYGDEIPVSVVAY